MWMYARTLQECQPAILSSNTRHLAVYPLHFSKHQPCKAYADKYTPRIFEFGREHGVRADNQIYGALVDVLYKTLALRRRQVARQQAHPGLCVCVCVCSFWRIVCVCCTFVVSAYTNIHRHSHPALIVRTYTYVHIRTYTHVHIRTFMCKYIHSCVYTYIHVHTYIYVCIRTFIYVHSCAYTYIHVHIRTFMCIYVHSCAHTYIYVYIRAFMCIYVHYVYVRTFMCIHIPSCVCKHAIILLRTCNENSQLKRLIETNNGRPTIRCTVSKKL